jgi:hypothetical protein
VWQEEPDADVQGGDPIAESGNPRLPLILLIRGMEVTQDILTYSRVS